MLIKLFLLRMAQRMKFGRLLLKYPVFRLQGIVQCERRLWKVLIKRFSMYLKPERCNMSTLFSEVDFRTLPLFFYSRFNQQ